MTKITYISGGERSGKSSYAMTLALEKSNSPIYLATARMWDDDFEKRISHHKMERDDRWSTIEEEKYLSKQDFTGKTVLLDCVTLWLNNFFYDLDYDRDKSYEEAAAEWERLIKQNLIL